MNKITMHPAVTAIAATLREVGEKTYLVGGAVRDMLLGKEPHDWDIATTATPEVVQAVFPETYDVGIAFGVINVVVNGETYEVATLRKEHGTKDGRHPKSVKYTKDIREDLARRDFTINAMAIDIATGEIIDPFDGQIDLEEGVLRTVGNPRDRFKEDYLRMMRAIRFSAGLEMNADITFALMDMGKLVGMVSVERYTDELLKILGTIGNNYAPLYQMMRCGMFNRYLPELVAMVDVEQNPEFHPEGDVWAHTAMVVACLPEDDPILRLAGLLHDVGKITASFYRADRDKIVAYGHDKVGAEMAAAICDRLRLSTANKERVVELVRHHMVIHQFADMKPETQAKKVLEIKDIDGLLALGEADEISSRGDLDHFDAVAARIRELAERKEEAPIVTGKFLVKMGLKPGQQFGEIIKRCRIAQMLGTITDEDSAREFIARRS